GCDDLAPHLRILELPAEGVVQGFRRRRLPHVHAADVVDADAGAHDGREGFVLRAVGDEEHAVRPDLLEDLVQLLREDEVRRAADMDVPADRGDLRELAVPGYIKLGQRFTCRPSQKRPRPSSIRPSSMGVVRAPTTAPWEFATMHAPTCAAP